MTNQRVLSVRSSLHWPLCTGSDHPQANQFTLGLRSSSYWSLCTESNHHQTNQCIQSPRSFSLNFVCLVRSSSETVRGENVDSAEGVALYIDAYFQQWWWWIWCTCWDFTFVNFMLYTLFGHIFLSLMCCVVISEPPEIILHGYSSWREIWKKSFLFLSLTLSLWANCASCLAPSPGEYNSLYEHSSNTKHTNLQTWILKTTRQRCDVDSDF